MKVNIVVDCTPDEARRFMGLPDVAPMQGRLVAAMEQRLVEAIAATDTATLVEQWLPLTLKGVEQWQSLWGKLAGASLGGAAGPAGAAPGATAGAAAGARRRRTPPAG